jgi:hypothetical protein
MRCVTCVRYVVCVNGELTELVVPSRGIWQGDPISPCLFLICMEGLFCLMQQMETRGELYGIRNGRIVPSISHLLFAYDSTSLQEVMIRVWMLLKKHSRFTRSPLFSLVHIVMTK